MMYEELENSLNKNQGTKEPKRSAERLAATQSKHGRQKRKGASYYADKIRRRKIERYSRKAGSGGKSGQHAKSRLARITRKRHGN